MTVEETIRENLASAEAEIGAACRRCGRTREGVTLIAVSKTFPPEAIDAAVRLGIADIGENRVQELRSKIDGVVSRPRWHMIGHLQSNKVKEAVRLFDVVQTVDSASLAEKIDREAACEGKKLDVLIQVNVGGEEQKSGVEPDGVVPLAKAVASLPHLALRGLMTVPPVAAPEETRQYFRMLRELRGRAAAELGQDLQELSMGMSDDYPIAIEEGSTMIRLGRSIFGRRETK